ncbi:hypothetical protein ACS0TY_003931 [Phlomoides rotata]
MLGDTYVLDRIDDAMGLEESDIIQRNKSTAELIRFGQYKESLLSQKAKARWLKKGDVNSSYYHNWINKGRKFNSIEGLVIEGRWTESVEGIKTGIQKHFERHFNLPITRRPKLPHGLFDKVVDECSNQVLTAKFTEEEVKAAIWECDSDKSPGPDGFSLGFIKECWNELKEEIMEMMGEFHQHGNQGKGVRQDINRVVGNGKKTKFWSDTWVGEVPLNRKFSRLFRISCQKGENIFEMGRWEDNSWEWELKWSRELRERDQFSLTLLMSLISRASLKRDEEDRWQWIHSCSGLFTVTSAYQIRDHSEQEESADQLCSIAFKRLWKSFAPRRYQAIIWKLLHNRMPTKDRLQRIGIIPASEATTCALCGEEKETAIHLFLFCSFAREVWSKIQGWLGITMVPHYTPSINFLQFGEIMGQGEKEKIISTIWVCTNWVLWNCRNKANFKGEIPKIDKMIGEIKARTWNWTTTKVKVKRHPNFRDWDENIRLCFDARQM